MREVGALRLMGALEAEASLRAQGRNGGDSGG
jgi:hypothetical protein